MSRTTHDAARELCLSFPEAEEFQSQRAQLPSARRQGVRDVCRKPSWRRPVAVWLPASDGAQERLTASDPDNYFVPPYVGPRGWIGVRLDRCLAWPEIHARVREAYRKVAPQRLWQDAGNVPAVDPPVSALAPAQIDPLQSDRARHVIDRLRAICAALPETSEGLQFGSPVWRAGSKTFVGLTIEAVTTADGAAPSFVVDPQAGDNADSAELTGAGIFRDGFE